MCVQALLLAVAAALAVPAATAASGPLHFREDVGPITVPRPGISAFCGFAVFTTFQGMSDVTLFLDSNGNPVREIDTSPSFTITFFAPSTGKSFSYPGAGTLESDYSPDLTTAVVTFTGLTQIIHLPGQEPFRIVAGRRPDRHPLRLRHRHGTQEPGDLRGAERLSSGVATQELAPLRHVLLVREDALVVQFVERLQRLLLRPGNDHPTT
jgi:hypothetical protein